MVDKRTSEKVKKGRITIDSGAAESVIHPTMFEEVPTRPSPGSRSGLCYIAANGSKMPNMGEKHVKFRTKEGMMSSVLFPSHGGTETPRIRVQDCPEGE